MQNIQSNQPVNENCQICKERVERIRDDFNAHVSDSPAFRDKVVKHDAQIMTMEKAVDKTMQDITDIKDTLVSIKNDIKDLDGRIKVWVLSGLISAMVIFSIPIVNLFYNAGMMAEKVHSMEKAHNDKP